MYPRSCPACGRALASKASLTHHRRRCRGAMAAALAALVRMPAGLAVEHAGGRLRLAAAGGQFVVTEGRDPPRAFADAAAAAHHFLARRALHHQDPP